MILFILFCLFSNFFINPLLAFNRTKDAKKINYDKKISDKKEILISNIQWEKLEIKNDLIKNLNWEKANKNDYQHVKIKEKEFTLNTSKLSLNSLNRSVVFNNRTVGPDISWIVPPAFTWSKKHNFDFTIRGHNTRIPAPPKRDFFGWNDGDAVGQLSYQFLKNKNSSFGLNMGLRSVYEGGKSLGGGTTIGEGVSAGFRWDTSLSQTSGIAFGAEQLIHFDSLTDTGRNIYITASKGWWTSEFNGNGMFPLYVATAGVGTGRMAVGTLKGLCSDSLGGSGTEINYQRRLCWSPLFSLAKVWNKKYSTFFEYNSRFFILGTSLAPIENIPIRGTFGLILSDHVDNYKLHNGSELNWVFNLSMGF